MVILTTFVAVLLSVRVTGRAPGDGHALCTGTSAGVLQAPVYPSGVNLLMDSFHYLNLLPPHDAPAWQHLNLDDNNAVGAGTEWSQNRNFVCRQSVTVCGFGEGVQNNWLITQYISRTVNGALLHQVSVQVEFELSGCTDMMCQRGFSLTIFETSRESGLLSSDTNNFQLATRLSATDDTKQNQTRDLNFGSEESGFYVAIVDDGTCVVITRILVFYKNFCPPGNEELVIRPITTVSTEIEAECVAGASSANGDAVRLRCGEDGMWTTVTGSGRCRCHPGFRSSDDRRSCVSECDSGQYYSMLNEECRDCSEAMESGLLHCLCKAPGEEDLSCTYLSNDANLVPIVAGVLDIFFTMLFIMQ